MSSTTGGNLRTRRPSDPRYAELPGVLKNLYSPEEFAWLDDMRKRELERIETEPEWPEP
jgi:hypothetical protein